MIKLGLCVPWRSGREGPHVIDCPQGVARHCSGGPGRQLPGQSGEGATLVWPAGALVGALVLAACLTSSLCACCWQPSIVSTSVLPCSFKSLGFWLQVGLLCFYQRTIQFSVDWTPPWGTRGAMGDGGRSGEPWQGLRGQRWYKGSGQWFT